jgi:YHS domain-containing protein
MLRLVLLLILFVFIARAFWRLVDGVIEGLSGQPRRPATPIRGVPMARDPICGTFVVPDNAVSLTAGHVRHYFCSSECRDRFVAQQAGRRAGNRTA